MKIEKPHADQTSTSSKEKVTIPLPSEITRLTILDACQLWTDAFFKANGPNILPDLTEDEQKQIIRETYRAKLQGLWMAHELILKNPLNDLRFQFQKGGKPNWSNIDSYYYMSVNDLARISRDELDFIVLQGNPANTTAQTDHENSITQTGRRESTTEKMELYYKIAIEIISHAQDLNKQEVARRVAKKAKEETGKPHNKSTVANLLFYEADAPLNGKRYEEAVKNHQRKPQGKNNT